MLKLKNIVKTYVVGDTEQEALKNINITFRENEFVSILGQSGSGKTTMLNIIGGLDRYTSGDLVINGISTKKFRDSDWDNYRNRSIGFVFQSYNLIPHQTVLANVELALTLAGISKKERHERAVAVLEKVGLKDHIHKRPNQMSGGQMQRVAIARALINNPDILLADEPTGALDSETSIQIMELLKEIAKDKLVIMVTHNPDLAERYSTRIVRLLDGNIISDSNPYEQEEKEEDLSENRLKTKKQKVSMSFFTALTLSFNNLRTKKGRTLLTSFAGSIGIIGIALILALSSGIQAYVDNIQKDTLSAYPITIEKEDSGLLKAISENMDSGSDPSHDTNAVYSNSKMYSFFNAAFADGGTKNNLKAFKEYLDKENDPGTSSTDLNKYTSTVQYQYDIKLNTYVKDASGKYHNTDYTSAIVNKTANESESSDSNSLTMEKMMNSSMANMNMWTEILQNKNTDDISDMLYDQYDLVYGKWPKAANDVVLILDKNNEITDVAFYALGLMSKDEVKKIFSAVMNGEKIETKQKSVSYDEILKKSFKMVLTADCYSKSANGLWKDISDDEDSMDLVIKNGLDLNIVGIIRPNPDSTSTSLTGTFGYTRKLTDYIIEESNKREIIIEQKKPENKNKDVISGLPFVINEENTLTDGEKVKKIKEYFSSLNDKQKEEQYIKILSKPSDEYLSTTLNTYMASLKSRDAIIKVVSKTYNLDEKSAEEYLSSYSDDELQNLLKKQLTALIEEKYEENARGKVAQIKSSVSDPTDLFAVKAALAVSTAFDDLIASSDTKTLVSYYDNFMPSTVSNSTLKDNLTKLGSVDFASPSKINIYASSFENKEKIADIISKYNESAEKDNKISYTDYVAMLMSGVTTMINAVSYGLIAFVSISLVVSSIMIGIITYISVLERTKEIGILRSVGASKKDISRVFNAETIIIGFSAGIIGIGITLLLSIPINILMKHLVNINNIAALPPIGAIILIIISMLLTMIAGLIPAKMAAKKDPVVALRTE